MIHADSRGVIRCIFSQVRSFFAAVFGDEAFGEVSAALARPPAHTCLRVSTTRQPDVESLRSRLNAALAEQTQGDVQQSFEPLDRLPNALVCRHAEAPGGDGPGLGCSHPELPELQVVVSRECAEAVLRGADVFAPGVLGASKGISRGSPVAVVAALAPPGGDSWCGIRRGTVLGGALDAADAAAAASRGCLRVPVAAGTAELPRAALFDGRPGVAVRVTRRLGAAPGPGSVTSALLSRVCPGEALLQNLPSIAAAAALRPRPGATVLDMCASPGGKTTAFADLVGPTGRVVAVDRTVAKALEVARLAQELGVGGVVRACVADSTRLLDPAAPEDGAGPQGRPAAAGAGAAEAESEGGGAGGRSPGRDSPQQPAETGREGREAQAESAESARAEAATDGGSPAGPRRDADPPRLRGAEKVREREVRKAARAASYRRPPGGGAAAPHPGSDLLAGSAGKRRLRPAPAGAALPPAAFLSDLLSPRNPAAAPAPPPVLRLGPGGLPRESFESILLDAPCSATGLRPRLCQPASLGGLVEAAGYQRRLLAVAAELLAPGGALVYSTCSISPLENEHNVSWALEAFPELRLVPAEPLLGAPGLTGPARRVAPAGEEGAAGWERALASVRWLTPEQARWVQRFGPGSSCGRRRGGGRQEDEGADDQDGGGTPPPPPASAVGGALVGADETIGFFIARFEKQQRSEGGGLQPPSCS